MNEIKRDFPEIKYYDLNNKVKISAGWLIEKCGWKRKKLQNCSVYNKQALVLINHGNATGIEINNLANKIILDINAKFGIKLQNEVQIF